MAVLLSLVVFGILQGSPARAQLTTRVGSFKAKTTGPPPPSNRLQAITGVGFQPAAVIFFWTPQTTAGFADNATSGYGFAAGPGTDRAAVYAADHNLAPQGNPIRRQSTTYCITVMASSAAGTTDGEAALSSMDADGFTVSWEKTPTQEWLIHYIAIGGADVTNATTGSFTPLAGTGSQAITGVGFQPDFLMFLSIDSNSVDTNVTESKLGIGFAGLSGGSTITEAAIVATSRDVGGANVVTGVWQRTDRAILEKNTNLASSTFEAQVTSFDANGFTINKLTNTGGTETTTHYLALQGGQYNVGTVTKPAATGSQSYTGVGFRPHGMLFLSKNIGTSPSANQHARISFSAADDSSFPPNQRATFFEDHTDSPADNDRTWVRQATSGTDVTNGKLIYLAQAGDCPPAYAEPANPDQCTGTARLIADADLTSYDADGFTLDWTTADNTNVNDTVNENNAEIISLAFGDDETASMELGLPHEAHDR
jgi:hypothetical protein